MKNNKQALFFWSLFLLLGWLPFSSVSAQGGDCLNVDVISVECDEGSPTWSAVISVSPNEPAECDTWFGSDGSSGEMNQQYTVGPFNGQTEIFFVNCNTASDSCITFVPLQAPAAFPCPANSCGMSFNGFADTTFAVCNGPLGSVTFNLTGDGNYYIETYDENGDLFSTTTNSPTVGDLPGGDYSFTLLCEDGSFIGETFAFIGEDAGFQAQINVSSSSSCEDYVLDAVPSDAAQYTYLWSTGETTPSITAPGGGIYQVSITDSEGCESIAGTDFLQNGSFQVVVNTFESTCNAANGGASAFVPNGNPITLSYAWPNGDQGPASFGYAPGDYELTVTNNALCEVIQPFTIGSIELFIDFSRVAFTCEGTATLTVYDSLVVLEGFDITWTDADGNVISNEQTVVVEELGIYTLTVTDPDDPSCTFTGEAVVLEGISYEGETAITVEVFSDSIFNGCGLQLSHRVIETDQFLYSVWEVPGQEDPVYGYTINPSLYGAGLYVASSFATDSVCGTTDSLIFLEDDFDCVSVSGLVYLNAADDCDLDEDDFGIPSQLLIFTNLNTNDDYYGYSAGDGTYSIALPPGNYSIDIGGDNELLSLCEPAGFNLVEGVPLTDQNISVSSEADCPRVTVDVTVPLLRRCFDNYVYIQYENTGSVVAEDVIITVEVGEFASSVGTWFGQEPVSIETDPVTGITTATFNVGDLNPFDMGNLYLNVFSCSNDFPLGAAGCITATVSPNNPCPPADPDWSGASLRVDGTCNGEEVVFTVENVGTAPTTSALSYVVIEDGVLLSPQPLTDSIVDPGEQRVFSFPANGATYHFQVEQEPLHPGLEMPTDFVEACSNGQQISYGFALQFPLSDDAYWIDEECNELIGAYDPNDKRAMPRGYSENHYIEAGEMIDYTIRFQNTGTDTAFNVVVSDVLSGVFDLNSLVVTGSTHEMEPRINSDGDNLSFVFENIMLVDSFTNEPGSHGAVSFRIRTLEDLNPGTDVDNEAAIYFDFNDPVITNLYHLEVEEDFVSVSVFDFNSEVKDLRVFPNPTAGLATIQLPEAMIGQELQLEVYDMLGRSQLNYSYRSGDLPQADLSRLPAGWYNLRLSDSNGQVLGNGRVLLQR